MRNDPETRAETRAETSRTNEQDHVETQPEARLDSGTGDVEEPHGEEADAAGAEVRISVVVLSKDEPELDGTLAILHGECMELDAECLVIDASAGRLDWIAEKHPWVRWIAYEPPAGLSSSIPQQRNVGVRAAVGTVIAFCDAGGRPTTGWLDALTRPILQGLYRYTCGPVCSIRPGVYRTINDVADGGHVESPPTANVAFERQLFDQVGGFDDRYAYGSDVDFAWRCADVGGEPRCVRAAVMGMDWGVWTLQRKRSWRYGRARARLVRIHPNRRLKVLTQQPEIIAYPALMTTVVAGAVTGLWRRNLGISLLAASGAAGAVLRWRNRRQEQPWAVMAGHSIYGAGFVYETALGPRWGHRRRPIRVVHTPVDDGPYVRTLVEHLSHAGVNACTGTGPTRSQTLNVAVMPMRIVWWKLKGVDVWHLHWTWGSTMTWAHGTVAGRVLRWWFSVQLRTAKRCGIRVVWTAHNLYPHQPVFDDDAAARRTIVAHADAVIVHSDQAGESVRGEFAVKHYDVIAQGVIPVDRVERSVARAELGVADTTLVVLVFGKILRYKGVDRVVRDIAAYVRDAGTAQVMLRVVGECTEDGYRRELEELARAARTAGVEIEFVFERASDERLAVELGACDASVFALTNTLNSSTVRTAQAAGTICLVRRGTPLEHDAGVVFFDDEPDALAAAIAELAGMDEAQRSRLRSDAREQANGAQWSVAAEKTAGVYERVLRGRS